MTTSPELRPPYFRSQQEARESLLSLILRRQPVDAWFWPAVSGTASGSSPATQIEGLIGKLSHSEASWLAVAAAVFAVDDPVSILSLLADRSVHQWLSELDRSSATPSPVHLPDRTWMTVERAAAAFGREDPRVVWLVSLAVILASPLNLESGVAVSRARMCLRTFRRAMPYRDIDSPASFSSRADGPPPPGDYQETGNYGILAPQSNELPASVLVGLSDSSPSIAETPSFAESDARPNYGVPPLDVAIRRTRCDGEPTAGAGLYFLLNALDRLKIADRQFEPQFLAHLFQRVARRAGIETGDPILLWTFVTLEESEPYEPDESMLRIWIRKVRRWCWRNGRIGISEIVRRPGLATLTRTDLDVSLSLDSADIRIRRIGLDLDPGWLPWFGRVVRFHYCYRGEFS